MTRIRCTLVHIVLVPKNGICRFIRQLRRQQMTMQSDAPAPKLGRFEAEGVYSGTVKLKGLGLDLDFIPWDIKEPQPTVVAIERAGGFTDPVLEVGAGRGDNACYLASRGYQVTAVEGSLTAVEEARRRARERGVDVPFHAAHVARMDEIHGSFGSALDWGMYHNVDAGLRRSYVTAMHRLCKPGAIWHIGCFTDSTGSSLAMNWLRITHESIREDLDGLWEILSVEETTTTASVTREWVRTQPKAIFDPDKVDVDEQGRLLWPMTLLDVKRV